MEEKGEKLIPILLPQHPLHKHNPNFNIIIQESDFEPRLQGGVKEKKNSPRRKREVATWGVGGFQNLQSPTPNPTHTIIIQEMSYKHN